MSDKFFFRMWIVFCIACLFASVFLAVEADKAIPR